MKVNDLFVGKNIRYGVPQEDDTPEATIIRMAQPLTDPVKNWQFAKPDDVQRLRMIAIQNGTPEDRLQPGFEKRVIEITGSDDSPDRYNSRILQDGKFRGKKYGEGWKLSNYKRNPVFMPMHNYEGLPVGQSLHTYHDKQGKGDDERKRLRFIIMFTDKAENPLGDTMLNLYRGGFMRASSVGWWPEEWIRVKDEEEYQHWGLNQNHIFAGLIYATNELLELSGVPVPGNASALVEDEFTAEEIRSFKYVADQAREVAPAFADEIMDYLNTCRAALAAEDPVGTMVHKLATVTELLAEYVPEADADGEQDTPVVDGADAATDAGSTTDGPPAPETPPDNAGTAQDASDAAAPAPEGDGVDADVADGPGAELEGLPGCLLNDPDIAARVDAAERELAMELRAPFVIQSLIFPKEKGWNADSSAKWARDHEFSSALDETETSYRYRQRRPGDFNKIRTLCLSPAGQDPGEKCRIVAVGGTLKEGRDTDGATEMILIPSDGLNELTSSVNNLAKATAELGEATAERLENLEQGFLSLASALEPDGDAGAHDGTNGDADDGDGEDALYGEVLNVAQDIVNRIGGTPPSDKK